MSASIEFLVKKKQTRQLDHKIIGQVQAQIIYSSTLITLVDPIFCGFDFNMLFGGNMGSLISKSQISKAQKSQEKSYSRNKILLIK